MSTPVPPVARAVIVPSLNPQDAGDALAFSVGPAKFRTVTGNVAIHPLASFTNKV